MSLPSRSLFIRPPEILKKLLLILNMECPPMSKKFGENLGGGRFVLRRIAFFVVGV